MIIVIYAWLAYFNNMIAGFSQSQIAQTAEHQSDAVSFWQKIKNGTAIVYGGFMNELRILGDILKAPREYIIQPPK
jgi:hypothetical protein